MSKAIVLSVLLQYTDSDYSFGIFKVFLSQLLRNNKKFTLLTCQPPLLRVIVKVKVSVIN